MAAFARVGGGSGTGTGGSEDVIVDEEEEEEEEAEEFDSSTGPRKRRRLDHGSTHSGVGPGSGAEEVEDGDEDEDEEDGFDPPAYPVKPLKRATDPSYADRYRKPVTPQHVSGPSRAKQVNSSGLENRTPASWPKVQAKRPPGSEVAVRSVNGKPGRNGVKGSMLSGDEASESATASGLPSRPAQGGYSEADIARELEDLPSDAFASSLSSSPEPVTSVARPAPSRVVGGGGPAGFRQTTLFGNAVPQASPPRSSRPPAKNEPPTHHELNPDALQTWVYPTNLGSIRDYQFNIVQKGLFHNLLVALPTGLGKTFIAATVMLNWFRWTTHAQIVFVAPTKPLVSQQVNACFGIVGIPRSQTTMLTGEISPALRAEEWANKRVFFMTPQTLINDLKTGLADPKKIVCIVVDEAHRATGNYAYVEVVKFMKRFNSSFRVLALTATPGSSVETVQQVIDGLGIARVEIRTEESLDIRQYVHSRKTEVIVFDPTPEIEEMGDLFSKALKPVLSQLNQANAYWVRDPLSLTPYGLVQAKQQWMNSDAGRRANPGLKGKMFTIFTLLSSLAHSIKLLEFHGIAPFYHILANFRSESEQSGNKGSKYKKQILDSRDFQDLMRKGQQWINNPNFIGHPKLEYLVEAVLKHFCDAGEGTGGADGRPPSATRIMVFVHFRDSAEEVVRILKRHEPMIRPHVFVGQATSKGSEGMNQKMQLDVVSKFQKGVYNTLVATCIGEEGLDIGEVDLIVCYDSSSSPIRMLQRMGRTGRKRAGNIALLLMRGKEEESFTKAKDNYEKMQQMITAGTRFNFHDDESPRILPKDIHPVVDKRHIDIPVENSQTDPADLPLPKKRGKLPKRPPKKFHMPDGVQTGFVKASRMHGDSGDVEVPDWRRLELEEEPVSIPALDSVLLSKAEQGDLERSYQNVYGGEGVQTVSMPLLDSFPDHQRQLGKTKLVKHGRVTSRMIRTFISMHDMGNEGVGIFENHLHPEDQRLVEEQASSFDLSLESELPRPKSSKAAGPTHVIQRTTASRLNSDPFTGGLDDNDDLDGFIVGSDAEELPAAASASSPSSMDDFAVKPKTFYTPRAERDLRDSDSDSLPEISKLVESKRVSEVHHTPEPSAGRPRKKKRQVVTSSDEE